MDEDTFVKWKHTLTPDGMYDTDRGQQAKKEKLSGYVRKKDGSRVIGLNKEKNCPFLNGKKLCSQYPLPAVSVTDFQLPHSHRIMNDADPATTPVETFDNGTATVNTETCEGLGLDLETVKKDFEPLCTQVNEIVTAESFDDVEK